MRKAEHRRQKGSARPFCILHFAFCIPRASARGTSELMPRGKYQMRARLNAEGRMHKAEGRKVRRALSAFCILHSAFRECQLAERASSCRAENIICVPA